jgi:hypothetical protein
LRQAVEMGAAWERFPVYFADVQETRGGPFNWERYDATIAATVAAGIKVQGILLGYPKWGASGDWLKDWEQFVRATVSRYKDRVRAWEVWNEPDLKADNGEGVFWKGSPADYLELLKVTYRTIKSIDRDILVLLGGLSFTWNNQDWFPRFLEELAKDPAAKEQAFYFDVLALHQYGRPSTLFDLPVGYVGRPSFAGFRALMQRKGFDKPIWANEVGVPIWNVGTGKNGPGRATADEAANFIWQAFAYGFAAGVEKIFIFQLYDDGASTIDPATKQPADYFGLISNGGEVRPAYRAYQAAVKLLSGAKLVTRVNLGRKNALGAKGWDAITFWGTPAGKVTIAWSNIGQPAEIVIPATTPRARLLDKFGNGRAVSASNGGYLLKLPAATNNNNFGCISGECAPQDYIIGGEVQILVEEDQRVPAVTIDPLGPGSIAPFTVSWRPVRGTGAGWSYDVQVKEDNGEWRDWIVGSPQRSAVYGERPDLPVQFEKTYQFRVRARDRDGNVIGMGYPPHALATTTVLGGTLITTTTPAAVPIVFQPTAPEFAQHYARHDGLRLLGRAISPAFLPPGSSGKVQYFEKGRLEDHSATQRDPAWRFQYGLLVDELHQAGATLPIGGEASTLTYKDLTALSTPERRVPPPAGHSGNVVERADGSVFIPFTTDLRSAPGHTVPPYFWRYITRADLFPGGWLHDIGLPITEPVEATVTKGSVSGRKIIIQAFQRTILTYDPANPPDWQVERANVGTDYRRWFPSRVPAS